MATPAESASRDDDGGHLLVAHVKVHVFFAGGHWYLDPLNVGNLPLDGLNGAFCAEPSNCPACASPEGEREREAAWLTPYPNADRLLHMLAAELHYRLEPIGEGR